MQHLLLCYWIINQKVVQVVQMSIIMYLLNESDLVVALLL